MTGGPLIDAYLGEVAAALPGPDRARRDIVAELRSGLLDAADTHRAAGLPAGQAAEAAISEFGDPRQIAAAFRPELAARQARRVALTLVTTGPPIGLLWAAAALASHIGIRHAPPWQWASAPPASPVAFPLAAAALLIAVWTALFTLAATGPLTRWLPASARLAPATAAVAGFGAAAADLAIFVLLASQLASAPSTLAPAPVAAAAIASLTRLTLARRGARRCLAARAALTPGH
jgi:HAAS